MVVILLVRQDWQETRNVLGRDEAEEARSRHAIVETRTGQEESQYQAHRIDPQRPLTPCACLAPILPTRRAPSLGGLHRWTVDARRTGGGARPTATRVRSRRALTIVVSVPSARPCAT